MSNRSRLGSREEYSHYKANKHLERAASLFKQQSFGVNDSSGSRKQGHNFGVRLFKTDQQRKDEHNKLRDEGKHSLIPELESSKAELESSKAKVQQLKKELKEKEEELRVQINRAKSEEESRAFKKEKFKKEMEAQYKKMTDAKINEIQSNVSKYDVGRGQYLIKTRSGRDPANWQSKETERLMVCKRYVKVAEEEIALGQISTNDAGYAQVSDWLKSQGINDVDAERLKTHLENNSEFIVQL